MKKIVLLSFLICTSAISFGQASAWKFSVAVDPSLTWASTNENLQSKGSKFAFDFTLLGENYFNERYAYYVGLSLMNFKSKIANVSGDALSFKADPFAMDVNEVAQFNVQYLTIPFGLKFRTPDYGMTSFYFQAGLYTGVRVGGSAKLADGVKHKLSSDYNLLTAGTQVGAGVMYATGDNTYLQLGIMYSFSFVDALSAKNIQAKPQSLGLRIGFLF